MCFYPYPLKYKNKTSPLIKLIRSGKKVYGKWKMGPVIWSAYPVFGRRLSFHGGWLIMRL